MQYFTSNQTKLAFTLAKELEISGCNVGECIQVLTTHLAGLIGRHAPDIIEIERFGVVVGEEITRKAIAFHNATDTK